MSICSNHYEASLILSTEPFIRYLISVKGVSAGSCGSKVSEECYTEEGGQEHTTLCISSLQSLLLLTLVVPAIKM